MREKKLVTLRGYGRKGIVLRVTATHLKSTGVQVRKPGLYIFSGYYGGDPFAPSSYGKIHGVTGRERAVGSLRSRHLAGKHLGSPPNIGRKLCRS